MRSRSYAAALIAVWALIFAYGIYFSALSIQRHRAFFTNASDLGQIDQAIWNTLQGRPLEFTRRTGEQSVRLTDHVEPIFIPTALVFLAYDNVEALLILQSFVIAIGALPAFWIARRRLAPALSASSAPDVKSSAWQVDAAALAFVGMYLLFPALEAANLAEFHAVTFVPALVLFAYYFGMLKRWVWFALFGVLLLMVKEEISLLVFMLGAYFATAQFDWRFREWKSLPARMFAYLKTAPRVPLVLALVSLVWFGLTFFVIIPSFNTLGRSPYTCRYVVSEDCREVARGLFLEQRLGYLVQLLASSGFVSLLDPVSLLLGAPLLLANVLSNYPAQYSGTFHYAAPVVPYFVLAAIGGTTWLARRLNRGRAPAERILLGVAGSALLVAVAYHAVAGYTPFGGAYAALDVNTPAAAERAARARTFERLATQIPPDAKLSTTPSLHPHLSHRQYLYRFPVVGDAEYVLLDVTESDRGIPTDFRLAYDALLKDNAFGVVDAGDGYVLLRRGAPSHVLPAAFYTPFRTTHAAPEHPMQIDFGDKVRFLGYDVLTDAYGRGSLRTYWQRLKPLDRNYFLFPFLADDAGAPLPDLNFPMTVLFWYPSAAWQADDIVVGKTVPLDWGDRVRLGVGVVDGGDWGDADARLDVTRVDPSTLPIVQDTWVDLGTITREGRGYVVGGSKSE